MAISVNSLAVELRILGDPSDTLEAMRKSRYVENLLAFAQGIVDQKAPDAPEWAKDEAVIRLAGYRFDAPSSPGGAGYSDFFTNSGAASLLANWISRRAVKIEEVRDD